LIMAAAAGTKTEQYDAGCVPGVVRLP